MDSAPGGVPSHSDPYQGPGPAQVRLGALLSAITVAQIASAFGIQWYTLTRLGVGAEADALYAGGTLPQAVTALLLEPLGFVLIPILSSKQEWERNRLAWPLLIGVGALSVLVTVALSVMAPLAVRVLAPGLAAASANLTVQLAQIQVLGVIGAAWGTVLTALSQSRGQFIWPALGGMFSTAAGWLCLVYGLDQWGVKLAAWTQVGITACSALIVLPIVGRPSTVAFHEIPKVGRDVLDRIRPLVISASYTRTGFVIDRFLASLLSPGSIASLDFSLRIHSAMGRVLNYGVAAPVIPTMVHLANRMSWSSFNMLWRRRVRWMGYLSVTANIAFLGGIVALHQFGALEYLTNHRIITASNLMSMWGVLLGCSGVIWAGGINHILVNAFYAQGETVLPAKIEMLTHTLGLMFKGIGLWLGGLVGIALAISAYYLLTSVILGVALHRRMQTQLRSTSSVGTPDSVPESSR